MDFDLTDAASRPAAREADSPLAALTADELGRLRAAATPLRLQRGEILMRRGDPPDNLYFLASGRLGVVDAGEVVGEIAPGEPVGEIGFFAGVPRTFTVQAIRDCELLALTRAAFAAASAELPSLRDSVIRALALRLARLRPPLRAAAPPRTIALIAAGEAAPPPRFLALLDTALAAHGRARMISGADVARQRDASQTAAWLNGLEAGVERLVLIADAGLSDWTRLCIRQADMALVVAEAGKPSDLGAAERFAFAVHPVASRRLALLHDKRLRIAQGTAAWLKAREVFMHHHVALEDGADAARLARFLIGRATGFVAGGGGALGAAHLALYKAFTEAGVEFDMLGGASIGAAMTAALAIRPDPDEIERRMYAMFVERRLLSRFNFPYHALLNHKPFDAALVEEFGEARIEDFWRPYFAVSADVTNRVPETHRDGPAWRAVRASSAIPGVLPPCFAPDGRMLVDGALFDNLPLSTMKALKGGPNLVVALQAETAERYAVDYESIPGPRDWLLRAATPWRRRTAGAPNIAQVITLSLLANRRQALDLGPEDWLVFPDMPAGVQWLQWRRQREVYAAAYQGAQRLIAERKAAGDAQLAALLDR